MIHAIIDSKTNIVTNIVILEGSPWLPPPGYIVAQNDRDVYDITTNTFTTPSPIQNQP